ncbi:MAG TPA: hypothetical protein DHW02_07885 [Ktedonobacter sp.]|nr:hypothetical protein [Ktedonobacter sp.]
MQNPEQTSLENLAESLKAPKSRRSLLRGAMVGAAGATGLAVAGTALWPRGAAHAAGVAASTCTPDSVQTILDIAATAEQLAVTFYTYGIKNAHELGITGQNFNYLTAAVVEEQLHLNLLVAAGGKPVTGTFSFPYGEDTFDYQDKFVKTLDQLETAFESAYLAAIRDFVYLNQPDLAVLAGQIVTVEAEHRALGRSISASIRTADNWAFTPVYVKSVADAANVLASEGYLSPKGNNSFSYKPASLNQNPDVQQRTPYVVACS